MSKASSPNNSRERPNATTSQLNLAEAAQQRLQEHKLKQEGKGQNNITM